MRTGTVTKTNIHQWKHCGCYLFTVRLYVAIIHEKFFLGSDNCSCTQKNRQIQWDQGFLIWTMAFWEKKRFVNFEKILGPFLIFYPNLSLLWRIKLNWFESWAEIKWKVSRFELLNLAMIVTFVNCCVS